MSQNIKIWKISLFLLLGLFAFLYIASSTVADIYFLIHDPVAGIFYSFDRERGHVVIEHVVPKGPADWAGIQKGDQILDFDHKVIQQARDLEKAYRGIAIGESIDITISRNGETHQLAFTPQRRLKVYTNSIFFSLLPGVIFSYSLFLIGLFVFLKRIEDRTAHIFYLMVIFWALAMWGVFPFGTDSLSKFQPHLKWLKMFFFPTAIGLLVHFTSVFPTKKKSFEKHRPWYLFLAYGPLLLLIPSSYAEIHHLNWGDKILQSGWGGWFTINFFVAINMLAHSRYKSNNPHTTDQAKIIYRGTLLTLACPIGLYFIPMTLFNFKIPYSEYALLIVVLWPLILAYAIVKHRFMDVDLIIKRGVAYTVMSGFVIAAYFLLVVGVGKLVLILTGSNNQIVTILATLFIAALFNPVKNLVQNFVDRQFFPNRFSYREAVRNFSHELVKVVDLNKLLELLQKFLSGTMKIRPIVVFWREKDTENFSVQNVAGNSANIKAMFSENDIVVNYLKSKQRLVDLSPLKERTDFISDEERNRWSSYEAELILPLLSKSQLVGFLTLGNKGNNEPYYKEDLELLETLSDQVNISLENALLTEKLKEQERFKKELEVARRIQLSSLPQGDPHVPGLDISGISIPALEVGGDYYDYLHFDDGRFGIVVGDVSGKGTSAALYMSQLKGILKTASKFHKSLKDLVAEVNAVTFNSIEEQYFITLTCGTFDLKKRKLHLVRAGHLPLIYFSTQKQSCQLLAPKGIGVGLENGVIFKKELEEVEIAFDSGDIFLFYSDGIVEARNPLGEEFETNLLIDLLKKNGYTNACALREKIISRVQAFAQNSSQTDDMTLVVVKVV